MKINSTKDGALMTIRLDGRLDTSSAPELEAVLQQETEGVNELIFDLEALSYTSSAGLRVFLKAQKMMNQRGGMKLIHVNEDIMEIFDMTGFTDILTIE